jgi:acyl-CoA synthetase (AMP-forming)/AMP-acid ligase II
VFDEASLREELNAILVANGKAPSLVRVLNPRVEELPLGPTGKVLKREVREKFSSILQGGSHV